MASYEDGYLQALMDVKITVRTLIGDPDCSPGSKADLLGVVSFLDALVKEKLAVYGQGDAVQVAAAANRAVASLVSPGIIP